MSRGIKWGDCKASKEKLSPKHWQRRFCEPWCAIARRSAVTNTCWKWKINCSKHVKAKLRNAPQLTKCACNKSRKSLQTSFVENKPQTVWRVFVCCWRNRALYPSAPIYIGLDIAPKREKITEKCTFFFEIRLFWYLDLAKKYILCAWVFMFK